MNIYILYILIVHTQIIVFNLVNVNKHKTQKSSLKSFAYEPYTVKYGRECTFNLG